MGVATLMKGLITRLKPEKTSSRKSDGATRGSPGWERLSAAGRTCLGNLIPPGSLITWLEINTL